MLLELLQMVQQTIDSKFNEYGLANTETGLPKHDKQLSVPVVIKKTALRDMQNDNRSMVPKSVGSSLLQMDTGPSVEVVKFSGTKRGPPEYLVSTPHQHSPVSNVANGHLVYVRRKLEAEPGKSSTDDSTSISADYPQSRVLGHENEKIQQHSHMKDSKICLPEAASIARTSSECFSSRKLPGPLPMGKFSNTSPSTDSNCLENSSATPSLDYQMKTNIQPWEERYFQLQNLLKRLDQSNQEGYTQSMFFHYNEVALRCSISLFNLILDDYFLVISFSVLRSFSSVELSRHAVELEKRSIQLSLEEGNM